MGSNFFGYGEGNMGNERGNGSSSRKGKKNSSDKPRQPQRGLGVAQLEKIRLHAQMGSTHLPSPFSSNYNDENMRVETSYSSLPSQSSFSYSSSSSSPSSYEFFHNIKMGVGDEYGRSHVGYGEHQPTTAARWDVSNEILEPHHFRNPNAGRHSLNMRLEDQIAKSKKHRNNSMEQNSQISELSETQELDLELRLSI